MSFLGFPPRVSRPSTTTDTRSASPNPQVHTNKDSSPMQAMTEAVDHLRTEVRLATESAPEWRNGFSARAWRALEPRLTFALSPSLLSLVPTGERPLPEVLGRGSSLQAPAGERRVLDTHSTIRHLGRATVFIYEGGRFRSIFFSRSPGQTGPLVRFRFDFSPFEGRLGRGQ